MHGLEEWRDIPDFIGLYQASTFGNIRSLPRNGTLGRVLSFGYVNGYACAWLSKNNVVRKWRVHRLVAMAFLPTDDLSLIVNHKDRDRANNCVENLEWLTYAGNTAHWRADDALKDEMAF